VRETGETGQETNISLDFDYGKEYNRDCSTIALSEKPDKKRVRAVKMGVPVSSGERTKDIQQLVAVEIAQAPSCIRCGGK
jgi:hypothetical protein